MAVRVTYIAKATEAVLAALDACDLGDTELRVTIEAAPLEAPSEVIEKADATIEKAFSKEIPIFKTEEERYVLGVVLEPLKEMGKTDKQNDLYSASEVRQACYRFMEYFGTVGLQHAKNVTGRVKIIENTITRVDEKIGGKTVKAGTWLMGIRVVDDELWGLVKDGKLTGFSIGGVAQRKPVVGKN